MERPGRRDSRVAGIEFRPPSRATSGTRSDKSGLGAFGDQSPLEVGQGGEDVEDEFAAGRRGVDGSVTNGAEADAPSLQVVNERHKMADGSPESVEPPDQQDVALAKFGKACFQSLAILLRPGCLVGEDQVLRHAMFFEGVKLELQVLLRS